MTDLLTPLPKYGDLYPLSVWFENDGEHLWTDWDGDGYWSTADRYSRLSVHATPKPEWATHVMWFNK